MVSTIQFSFVFISCLGWNVLLNSSTACAIRVYRAFGSSRFVPNVGFANALLVSMIRPLASAILSAHLRYAVVDAR